VTFCGLFFTPDFWFVRRSLWGGGLGRRAARLAAEGAGHA
jgi:hypothetical protein